MDAQQLFQVIILGIVQGIAEFLPISSSGHLVLVNALLGGQFAETHDHLAMNIALHLGTLGSILVVYRRELPLLCRDWRMLACLVWATLPVVVVGLTLKDTIEAAFNTPAIVACGLMVTALFLWLSETLEPVPAAFPDEATPAAELTWKKAVLIGFFQALALVPGISRSGSTISGGIMLGVPRELAARFSFLIAIPAIAGATVLQGLDFWRSPVEEGWNMAFLIGAVVSFIVGIIALESLLKIVRQRRLRWFALYCLCIAMITLAYSFSKAESAQPGESRTTPQVSASEDFSAEQYLR